VRPIKISYGLKRSKLMTLRIWLNIENIYVSPVTTDQKQTNNTAESELKEEKPCSIIGLYYFFHCSSSTGWIAVPLYKSLGYSTIENSWFYS
jgi:hypothetical protein